MKQQQLLGDGRMALRGKATLVAVSEIVAEQRKHAR